MAPYGPDVPENVITEANAIGAGIVDGSLHAFDGPIVDQDGTERIAAGSHASDEEMLKMDWYVEGVQA